MVFYKLLGKSATVLLSVTLALVFTGNPWLPSLNFWSEKWSIILPLLRHWHLTDTLFYVLFGFFVCFCKIHQINIFQNIYMVSSRCIEWDLTVSDNQPSTLQTNKMQKKRKSIKKKRGSGFINQYLHTVYISNF